MIMVEPQEYETYYQWIVNTKTRWCTFLIQRYFYDVGVVLEETDYDGDILEKYILEGFNPESLPFFNQEKDQIIVITLKEYSKTQGNKKPNSD